MESTRTAHTPSEEPDAAALAFAAFALAHVGCDGGTQEIRLDGRTLAGRCPRCDEVRIFRSAAGAVQE